MLILTLQICHAASRLTINDFPGVFPSRGAAVQAFCLGVVEVTGKSNGDNR